MKRAPRSTKPESATAARKSPRSRATRLFTARQDDLAAQYAAVAQVQQRYGASLLRHPDVTGLAIDFKMTGGQVVRPRRYVLQISVAEKGLPDSRGGRGRRLPARFHGVPTDIVAARYEYCRGGLAAGHQYHHQPGGGCAIARETQEHAWGTLGLVVRAGGRAMYLTNKHVAGPRGSRIVQPPLPETALTASAWWIGTVLRSGADDNRAVDCALIEPHPGPTGRAPGEPLWKSLPGNPPARLIDGELNDDDIGEARLFAWGAATSLGLSRRGTLRQTRATVKFPDGTYLVRQIKVESANGDSLAEPGDSGGVLFRHADQAGESIWVAVGLVVGQYEEDFGRGPGRQGLVANHFQAVRRSLRFARLDEN